MSWTSKWRIPSVRCMASRVIAKTSGRTSSSAAWIAAFSRSRRAFASSRRRSRSGCVRSSSDGSSGMAISRISSRISANRARISSSERAWISGSRAFAWSTAGWMRRISRSFESTNREKNFMGRPSIGGEGRGPLRAGSAPEAGAVPRDEDHEGQEPKPGPERDRHQPRRRLHLGVLEGGQPLAGELASPARATGAGRATGGRPRDAARGRRRRRVGAAAGSSVARGRAQQGAW